MIGNMVRDKVNSNEDLVILCGDFNTDANNKDPQSLCKFQDNFKGKPEWEAFLKLYFADDLHLVGSLRPSCQRLG